MTFGLLVLMLNMTRVFQSNFTMYFVTYQLTEYPVHLCAFCMDLVCKNSLGITCGLPSKQKWFLAIKYSGIIRGLLGGMASSRGFHEEVAHNHGIWQQAATWCIGSSMVGGSIFWWSWRMVHVLNFISTSETAVALPIASTGLLNIFEFMASASCHITWGTANL
jgi:hypothetical protein